MQSFSFSDNQCTKIVPIRPGKLDYLFLIPSHIIFYPTASISLLLLLIMCTHILMMQGVQVHKPSTIPYEILKSLDFTEDFKIQLKVVKDFNLPPTPSSLHFNLPPTPSSLHLNLPFTPSSLHFNLPPTPSSLHFIKAIKSREDFIYMQ